MRSFDQHISLRLVRLMNVLTPRLICPAIVSIQKGNIYKSEVGSCGDDKFNWISLVLMMMSKCSDL